MKVKRILGVVPQEIALYKDLTSMENLEFFGEIYGLSHKERRLRAEGVLGLLAYGIICFIIAMRFFRFQEKAA